MIHKFSAYEYELIQDEKGWYYVIYDTDYTPCESTVVFKAEERFESESEARFAAIGHIDFVENATELDALALLKMEKFE
jgi:hypothetical protein